MKTKFKEFKDKPKVGDFVICKAFDSDKKIEEKLNLYLENNIGVIYEFNENRLKYNFIINYSEIPPKHIITYFSKFNDMWQIQINDDEILYHYPNKQPLEDIITAKKYNL